MTPSERQQVTAIIDRLNEAAEEFRQSRDDVHAALLALIEANDHQAASIALVIKANMTALQLLNRETDTP